MLARLYLSSGKILNWYVDQDTLDFIHKHMGQPGYTVTNRNDKGDISSMVNLGYVEYMEVEYTNE